MTIGNKLKIWFSSIGSVLIAVFCAIFHIQRNKIKNLKAENEAKSATINNQKIASQISKETNEKTSEVKKDAESIKNDWYSKHPSN